MLMCGQSMPNRTHDREPGWSRSAGWPTCSAATKQEDISSRSAPTAFIRRAANGHDSINSRWRRRPWSRPASRPTGITGDKRWRKEARRAFEWFLGRNDLNLPIYDPMTGGCRDGLHPDRANENQGAESTLAFLQALLELRLAENVLQPVEARFLMRNQHLELFQSAYGQSHSDRADWPYR